MRLKLKSLTNIRGVKKIKVIETQTLVGDGTKDDPCRIIVQFWSKNGELLAQRDDWKEKTNTAILQDASLKPPQTPVPIG